MTTLIFLFAGTVALAGFPIGATFCERVGRVQTVGVSGITVALATVFSFWGPPTSFRHPVIWLALGFSVLGFAVNTITVGGTTSATELFPTPVRATALGCVALAGALGQLGGQWLVAALSPRFGIATIVGAAGFFAIGVSILFRAFVEESKGIDLVAELTS